MWGQGQRKGQDMNLRDPGEKRWKFQSCYFYHKKHCFYAEFYGEFNGAIFIFLYCIFLSKNEFENFFIWTFSKFLDDMKAIFEPIDLQFGIYIVNTYITHILYGLKILIFKNFIEYFSLKFIFWKLKVKNSKVWDSHFVYLIILRHLMFYNIKLLDNWRRCGRLNMGLILRENRV